MDNRGIDQEPGWINRQLRELRQAIEALRSERRGAATEITTGDLTVAAGGMIVAKHTDGTDAALLGTRNYGAGTVTGFVLTDVGGATIFRAVSGATVEARAGWLLLQHQSSSAKVELDVNGHLRLDGGPAHEVTINAQQPVAVTSQTRLTLNGGATNAVRMTTPVGTSSSPNLYADAFTNDILRSVSSRRYKQDIADHDIDPLSVLKMRVRTWRDRAEVEKDPDVTQRYIGFIAEELHDLGLTEFVSYDEQGRPDAVAYDRIPVALLIALRWITKQVRDERARTDTLEAKVTSQQQQIDALTARLDALSGPMTPPTTTRST